MPDPEFNLVFFSKRRWGVVMSNSFKSNWKVLIFDQLLFTEQFKQESARATKCRKEAERQGLTKIVCIRIKRFDRTFEKFKHAFHSFTSCIQP